MQNALWVFGYGSLMWEPGFPVAERCVARLAGYHRSFCMWSIHHRGTPEDPGLVLALDAAADAVCDGVALRVEAGAEAETLAYLRERELVSAAYYEAKCDVTLTDGRKTEAVTFIVDADHVQYCGDLDLHRQAEVIASAIGGRGPNCDYLTATARHMKELGLHDPDMEWLVNRVATLTN